MGRGRRRGEGRFVRSFCAAMAVRRDGGSLLGRREARAGHGMVRWEDWLERISGLAGEAG